MAQTLDEIYNEISAEASNYPVLSQLESNSSNLSFWHYIKRTIAFAILQLQIIFDQLKAEILGALQLDYNVGIIDWYKSVCKDWQYGDEIKIKFNTPYYETIDEAKKIIKRVSVKDITTGGLRVRVQKLSGTEIVQLSAIELSAFTTYINRRKMAGTLIDAQSNLPNIVTLNANVVLSKEIYSSTGVRHKDGKYGVLDASRNFVQNAEFDEIIYLSSLSDYMNDQEGIKAFHLTACTIDGTTATITGGKINLPNGYGKIVENDATFNLRMNYELI